MHTKHVAVVIASFRPGALIDRCLSSVLAQQNVARFDIIVIDSSADGTAERLERDFPRVDVVRLDKQTHQSAARNLGLARTQADFIAITDQDCVVPQDWLACLLARHREGDYAAVGGAVGNGTPSSPVGTASYLIEFNEFLPAGKPRLVPMIPHCNICFRREVFDNIGAFAEVPPGAEDQVFNFLLIQQGQRLLFDPDIVVAHLNRTSFSHFLRHQRLLGFGSAIVRRTIPVKGHQLVRWPMLSYGLPFVRLLRTAGRLLRGHRATFLRYLFLLPILVPGHIVWAAGFRAGLRTALQAGSRLESDPGRTE